MGDPSKIADFGQSWKVENSESECQPGPEEFPECTNVTVKSDCEILGDSGGVFGECQEIGMNVPQLIDNCIFDYCLEDTMKCAIIGSFANSCLRKLTNVDQDSKICQWILF